MGDYFNKKFVNLKIDCEKGEGKTLASKYGVSAYPTFIFVDNKGKQVYKFLGGRRPDGLIKEGEKAMFALKNQGKLKRMDKQYAKGNRKLKFLYDYYKMKASMGLDCGQVLVDYFSLISDEALLAESNAENVKMMTKFDEKVYNRLVEGIMKFSNTKKKKEFKEILSATLKSLGACVGAAAKADNEIEFEKILDFKKRLSWITSTNSVISASMGGGMIYLPAEQLRLDYYKRNGKVDKYKKTAIEYIYKMIEEREAGDKKNKMMKDQLKKQLDAAKKAGKSKSDIAMLKKMSGMMHAFTAVTDKYNASQIINAAEYYWDKTAEKTYELKKLCKDWALFAYSLDKTPKVAIACSDMLITIGCKKDAVKMLEEVVVVAVGATMVTDKDINMAKEKLKEVKALQ